MYIETSAMTGENVPALFNFAARFSMEKLKKNRKRSIRRHKKCCLM
jgi:translation initiation factor IF-2